jgi:uncharacterized protein
MESIELPLFPLNTVLFPGGQLKLKIFEQRYLDMTKRCIADQSGFGVVSANDDGKFASVGTVATITQWDMPHTGIFALTTQGAARFLVREHRTEKDGLIVGRVSMIPDESDVTLPSEFAHLAELVDGISSRYGVDAFPQPLRTGSASWVGGRLAEVMPVPLRVKQQLLEINDPALRLKALSQFLAKHGIVSR